MIKDIERLVQELDEVKQEVCKRIVGQEAVVERILIALFAGGNVLLESVPGLGKTEMIKTVGQVLALSFSRVQFTPDLMPSDIVGTYLIQDDGDGRRRFEFQKGPAFTNLLLADEINRATPKTQSALLQAMQEREISVGKETFRLAAPYFVMATQNPIEMEGTYPLPEAQLDRFMFKTIVKFPSYEELSQIVDRTVEDHPVAVTSVLDGDRVLEIRALCAQMPISDSVRSYALKLIMGTHNEGAHQTETAKRYLNYGSSPRGAQALIGASKVRAAFHGRANVAFEDVDALAKDVLRHRVKLNFEALSHGYTADDIIDKIISEVKA
ncbi:MAG: MoxR family ATPase [Clostridia bacterium]|nr:MoxR family ATPase [Clostridia bacterium]